MESPKKLEKKIESQFKKAFLSPPGLGGHQFDYTLHLDGYSSSGKFIPNGIHDDFKEFLGPDWEVLNRGSRLEFINRIDISKREDDLIINAIQQVLGPLGYDLNL